MKRGAVGGARAFSAGYGPSGAPAGSPGVGLVSGLLAARLQRK
jgi:hypothetical protein